MTFPSELTRPEIDELFPAQREPIKKGAFELGLVLGGTVSAGAYTAGVLDYIMEALDAWQRAKEDGDATVPPHEVVISTVAGASGGAINGAILLRSAGREFPHGPDARNPFYATWTEGVNLLKLLAPGLDPDAPGFASVLKCSALDEQAASTIAFNGQPLGSTAASPHHRAYLADPLRLMMTVGNVTGVPYAIKLKGETHLSHDLYAHADHMRFALTVEQGVENKPRFRPDEIALASHSSLNWNYLQDTALATSAFPLAFRARKLSRPLETAGYRVAVVPDESGVPGQSQVVQLVPNWELLAKGEADPAKSTFVNVDGGAFNNEPLDLVRTALAGVDDRNKRSAATADRATIMIDPFSNAETLSRPDQNRLVKMILPVIMSLVYQARMKPADVALAYAENVFSRFLIAPVRRDAANNRIVGQEAIASGAVGGFAGFVDSRFLRHDFQLGRYNAHVFLAKHLAIPQSAGNDLFAGWTADHVTSYGFRSDDPADPETYLPIIPLMDRLRNTPPTLPEWPKLPAPPELKNAIEARLQSVYEIVKSQITPDSWWKRALMSSYLWLGWRLYARGAIRDAADEAIQKALSDRKLT